MRTFAAEIILEDDKAYQTPEYLFLRSSREGSEPKDEPLHALLYYSSHTSLNQIIIKNPSNLGYGGRV